MMRLFFTFLLIALFGCQNPEKPAEKAVNTEIALADTTPPSKPLPQKTEYQPRFDYDTTQWFDLKDLDPSVHLDLRYASTNNFVEEVMYDCGRCFLRRDVAKAVIRAHRGLKAQGYGGLKFFDCYRPRPIQWKLWNKVPDPNYVADPRKGSMHNRGAAVDLTIVDAQGKELDMGTGFDFFGPEAHHTYTGHSEQIQTNRDLLKATMDAQGFRWIRTEWWHYSYRPKSYVVSDMLWNCESE
ncbi:MAG TPA: M15 family metallopeptidase [Saprospiraceae bacterium]|nr:M15 family metallopeptidase [Saprospiraceae bacterium]